MRFSVRVPVLSKQTAPTAPRVSMASRRRTTALCRRMSRMPRAMVTVATVGRPSGIAATAREMADLAIWAAP